MPQASARIVSRLALKTAVAFAEERVSRKAGLGIVKEEVAVAATGDAIELYGDSGVTADGLARVKGWG